MFPLIEVKLGKSERLNSIKNEEFKTLKSKAMDEIPMHLC